MIRNCEQSQVRPFVICTTIYVFILFLWTPTKFYTGIRLTAKIFLVLHFKYVILMLHHVCLGANIQAKATAAQFNCILMCLIADCVLISLPRSIDSRLRAKADHRVACGFPIVDRQFFPNIAAMSNQLIGELQFSVVKLLIVS